MIPIPAKTKILHSIKSTLQNVLPSDAHAFLYGSQARGDAGVGSDWDVLILLDKQKIKSEDYDNISYPLVELGWSLKEYNLYEFGRRMRFALHNIVRYLRNLIFLRIFAQ